MEDDERVARLGVLVEAVGQEHDRSQVHGPPPELRQPLALDADVLHIPGVLRLRDGRDRLLQVDPHHLVLRGVDRDLARGAEQVARCPAPLLALAAVHGQLHDVAVGPVEGLVPVEEDLDTVPAGFHLGEALRRKAEDAPVEDRVLARPPAIHVDAEDLLALRDVRVAHLEARLRRGVGREEEEQPPVERLPAQRPREAHRDAEPRGLPGSRRHRGDEQRQGGEGGKAPA